MAENPELDRLFGPLLRPGYVRDVERRGQFSNAFDLNANTARYFKAFLGLSRSYPAFRDLALNLCFLWSVDESGRIWIAMEEVCLSTQVETRFPRMRAMPLDASLEAMGHPLLVAGRLARIAGELLVDGDAPNVHWIINNKSGRYGFGRNRTPIHLTHVASAFVAVGLSVEIRYIVQR